MDLFIASIVCLISIVFLIVMIWRARKIKPRHKEMMALFAGVNDSEIALKEKQKEYGALQEDYAEDRKTLREAESLIDQYEVGIHSTDKVLYERTTNIRDLHSLERKLANAQEEAKSLVKSKQACICYLDGDIRVNDSKAEAKKLINREIKLRLRCFDNEVKSAIAQADWNNINRLVARLKIAYEDINQKGKIIKTYLEHDYLVCKTNELRMSFELAQLKADIKEAEKEQRRIEREAEREEARIKLAAEKATKDRVRMEQLVAKELAKLDGANEQQRALLEMHQQELAILKKRENRALSMAQQTRAGHVYVISNTLSFGSEIVKIGMTRRVDPHDRVRELGDASVPDTFDVHALYYSEDAPALESELHKCFADRRVNLINTRKEFFRVQADDVIQKTESGNYAVERVA